jgi:predicted ATPase
VRELVAQAVALSPDTVEEIVERADGVPLFLEEITKVVLETAVLGEIAGTSRLRANAISVPPTLQASLLARLDRLGPASRELAQTGAAIGRNFSYELVTAVCQRGEAETAEAIRRLVESGLVFQRGMPPAAEYQFKHALVQDTAYDTLLRGARLAVHARIAAAMSARSPEIAERAPEVLAHHLTEAGELDSAAVYWLEAGRRAVRQSANIEAAAHLARGIATLAGQPQTPERARQELALQLTLGPALLSNQGYGAPGAKAAYLRAAGLADHLDDDRGRFAASWGLWITAASDLDSIETQVEHLGALTEISERIRDPELILQAHHSSWATYFRKGELARSVEHIGKALALYDPQKHRHHALIYGGHDPAVCGKGFNALLLWSLGYLDQAGKSAGDSVALAERLGHVPSLLHALWFAGMFHCVARNAESARGCGERLLQLAREHRLMQYQAIGGIIRGWALAHLGRQEGLAEIRSSLRSYGEATTFMLDLFSALRVESELLAGALEMAGAALASANGADMIFWRSDLLRLRGDLHRNGPEGDPAAQAAYLEAIALAQAQQAKSLELRAATALARLWRDQGNRGEARDILAPVYAWFSEGFDMLDLKEARALLNALS